jgi:hypothetical protein
MGAQSNHGDINARVFEVVSIVTGLTVLGFVP